MRVLGLVSHTHDTGVALIEDGVPVAVIEEERLNREKKTLKFPSFGLEAALTERGLKLPDIDQITIPWNASRMNLTLLWLILRRLPMSATLIPKVNLFKRPTSTTMRANLLLGRKYIAKRLREQFPGQDVPPIQGYNHHHCHAAAFFVSPFEDATVLVIDGYGDDASTSIYQGTGDRLDRVYRNRFLDSVGIVYSHVTEFLGFRLNRDEGKVMGLSAYGSDRYVDACHDLFRLGPDGTYSVNMDYFLYDRFGEAKPFRKKFFKIFGEPFQPGAEITQRQKDIAFGLQRASEKIILHIVRHLTRAYGTKKLVLSGGVALNCVANSLILSETDVEEIWIPPNASDTGAPLGSTLWHYHQVLGNPRKFELKSPFYGCEYSDEQIESALADSQLAWTKLSEEDLLPRIGRDLSEGKIVGWFQGRFEMGPRALGNRSIIADPRRAEMKDIINARVKFREAFRPFAPAVLVERIGDYFQIDQSDPFMTIAPRVRPEKAHEIPAVVHEDGTGRIQTISRDVNPRYYGVIEEFYKITGVPIVINTSFNRQEPIVARPSEAISCFLRTGIDVLVLGDYYVTDRNEAAVQRAGERFVVTM